MIRSKGIPFDNILTTQIAGFTQTVDMQNMPEGSMKRVLFLCTGNSARSQMSEALLKYLGGDGFEVHSAGTKVAATVNPFALEVIRERGASTEGLYPKKVDQFMNQAFDVVITVCDSAKQACPHFPNAKMMLHWSLEDPAAFQGTYDEILQVFRDTREEIERRIKSQLL
ncbi:MAG: arsenate reductase ArsC [Candidatus Thorarchaeota archaeon]